jgi:hypothetical protein
MALFGKSKFERAVAAIPEWETELDPRMRERIRAIRADFVTDEDIARWMLLGESGRKQGLALQASLMTRFYIAKVKGGLSEEEALQEALRHYPTFGEPHSVDEPGEPQGEDRRLPSELHPRVAKWLSSPAGRAVGGTGCEDSTSMNALIRSKLRDGTI